MSNDGWTKVGGNSNNEPTPQWKPVKEGDEVSGLYVDFKDITTKLGQVKVYTLQQEDGTFVAVFGKTVIDREMAKLKLGDEVKIVYMGTERNPKSGFSFKKFDVYSRRPLSDKTATEIAAEKAKAEEVEEEIESDEIPF